jgi:predicted amidophosphoribosyltransferase
MIFIAGISPKIKIIDQNPRRCPSCGLHQAFARRVDHYLSLFFIPILRVKKGEPVIICDRCQQSMPGIGPEFKHRPTDDAPHCRYCGKPLNADFNYCPYCSKRI